MTKNRIPYVLSGLLAALALALSLSGCLSGGGDGSTDTSAVSGATSTISVTTTASTVPVAVDQLSTFQSKDPFRQQALPATSTTAGTGSTTTTASGGSTTTTSGGGTTTTTNPSNVTTPLHNLKVLSIDEVNGQPVVTFEVDGVIYEDQHVGDVVSTSWGQIEVVAIDPAAQTVTFLHGSETRTLAVGEEFLK